MEVWLTKKFMKVVNFVTLAMKIKVEQKFQDRQVNIRYRSEGERHKMNTFRC